MTKLEAAEKFGAQGKVMQQLFLFWLLPESRFQDILTFWEG
jgi:hypothetical protein